MVARALLGIFYYYLGPLKPQYLRNVTVFLQKKYPGGWRNDPSSYFSKKTKIGFFDKNCIFFLMSHLKLVRLFLNRACDNQKYNFSL